MSEAAIVAELCNEIKAYWKVLQSYEEQLPMVASRRNWRLTRTETKNWWPHCRLMQEHIHDGIRFRFEITIYLRAVQAPDGISLEVYAINGFCRYIDHRKHSETGYDPTWGQHCVIRSSLSWRQKSVQLDEALASHPWRKVHEALSASDVEITGNWDVEPEYQR